MAIVFVSAQNKQMAFFWGIGMLLVLFLLVVSLMVFLPEFLDSQPNGSLQTPSPNQNVTVNVSLLSSGAVENLELFSPIKIVFAYEVIDAGGKKITGTISAQSQQEAQLLLEQSGFKVESLREMGMGRDNPFVSY